LEPLTDIWNAVLVHPILNAILWLTDLTGSAGVAIILFTVAVRTLLLPLGIAQVRSQKAMLAMQPKLKEMQKRFEGDKQRQAQEQMRLYRESGVNPAMGCLPLVLQMPVWFALYSALITLANNAEYTSFHRPFLWIPDLSHSSMPNFENPLTWALIIFPVLTAATQWVVQRMSQLPTADAQQQQMNRMMEFMPLMFFFFSFQVAAGLTLYWVVSNVYSIFQQYIFMGWGTLPVPWNRREPPGPSDSASPSPNGKITSTNGTVARSSAPRIRTNATSSRKRRKK
jgi:YidC/Oxa1 family membrane protein insertase